MEVVFTEITQIEPVTPLTASVLVLFKVLGPLPDLVEVYATATVDKGNPVKTVKMKPQEQNYKEIIEVQAGTLLTIFLCPRTVTGQVLDDEIDGQPFETFCQTRGFTTKAQETGPSGGLPIPEIVKAVATPATRNTRNRVEIAWSSAREYTFFQIEFSINDVRRPLVKINSGGQDGSFAVDSPQPGVKFGFAVQGCIIVATNPPECSKFSAVKFVVSVPNSNSLRQFLANSGFDGAGGLRRLRPGKSTISVRQLLAGQ